jgi:ribonucleoside-diphosphate reductase beta chain
MSKQQYNLNTKTDYLNRKMFLDPAGPVTIQRFEEVKYQKLQKIEQSARGFFWVPEEVNLSKDANDMKDASEAVAHIFTSNVLRQTALDSLQGRAPAQVFTPVCSIPELEAIMSNWSFFETNIHSRSYSHIIRNIYNVPKEVFNTIHDTQEIIDMASSIGDYYDKLHALNCKKEIGINVNEQEHINTIWLALHASYALEAFRFMVSFATSLAMVENKIFMGNGNIISLILQDELLHKEWTAWMINQVVKEDPRFAKAKIDCEAEVRKIYEDVIREEKEWAEYLFKKGPVIGLNAAILKDFVDYTSVDALRQIGIKYWNPAPKNTPIPWFLKHVDTLRNKRLLQETESTNYVVGVMSDSLDYEELPNL